MAIQKLRRNLPLARKGQNVHCGLEPSENAIRANNSIEEVAHNEHSEPPMLESGRWDQFPDVSQEGAWKTCSPYFSVVQWWLPEVEGQCVGCHQFFSRLGHGSYGQVYASAATDGGLTAVKVMSKQRIISQGAMQAVTDECNVLSQLNHPNVCALKGTINGVQNFYIFMEYAGSKTLYALLRRFGPLDLRHTEHIFPAIMEGVDHMHGRGVAHCDLKPGNIVISDEGTPKIVDFGFAQKIDEPKVVGVRGTFPFIAPEAVLEPRKSHDLIKGDVWALGILLLEVMCGLNKISKMLGWPQHAPLSKGRVMQLVSFLNTPNALEVSITHELGHAAGRFAPVLLSMTHYLPERRLDTKAAELMLRQKWR